MDDEDDFIVVKGKIPRTNKDGSPTVGRLGAGGLRRDDGTVERLVQDLEPIGKPDDEPSPSAVALPYRPQSPPATFGQQLARAAAEGVVSGVSDSVRRATGKEPAEALVDFIEENVRRWWRERRQRKTAPLKAASIVDAPVPVDSTESAQIQTTLELADASTRHARSPLSREEAEFLYGKLLRTAAISEALRQRLSGAQIYDEENEQVIEDITRTELDQMVRQVLENNPGLITDILTSRLHATPTMIPGRTEQNNEVTPASRNSLPTEAERST